MLKALMRLFNLPNPVGFAADFRLIELIAAQMDATLSAARARGRYGWWTCEPENLINFAKIKLEEGHLMDAITYLSMAYAVKELRKCA